MKIELTREQVEYLLPKLYDSMMKQYNRGNTRGYHKMKTIHAAFVAAQRREKGRGTDNKIKGAATPSV